MAYDYYIGIDPGVKTGYALWSRSLKKFCYISSDTITKTMDWVKWVASEVAKSDNPSSLFIRVEDARKRKWFGPGSKAKLQGAGSIKRDCKMWESFLTEQKIPFEMVDPKDMKGFTKLDQDVFRKMAKWDKSTNEHSRDAAMLVLGR